MKTNIPEKFQLKLPIHHDTFLIDGKIGNWNGEFTDCLLYTSPSPRDLSTSRMPSSA